jgi:hypothetical protein
MPMRSTPRERIMERDDPAIARSVPAEIGKEVRAPQVDRPTNGMIGEGIHDVAPGRLVPLGTDVGSRRSVPSTNLVGG